MRLSQARRPMSRVLRFLALTACFGHATAPLAQSGPTDPAPTRRESPATDLMREALPPGAVARLPATQFNSREQTWCAALSPDGKTVVAAVKPDHIRILDAVTGKDLGRMDGVLLGKRILSYSPDGTRLALIGGTGQVHV